MVYFHGNGGNLSVWAPVLAGIAARGYSVVAVDYRGYGLSTGRPSERGLYRDADALLSYVARISTRPERIVYWGRSLGTAVAAYAASKQPPDRLILESGFPDARSLLRSSPPLALLSIFASYRFPTADFLRGVHVPILVVHGDRDRVVPYAQGRRLYEEIDGVKQFLTVPDGDHNDASPPNPAAYWAAIDAFISI